MNNNNFKKFIIFLFIVCFSFSFSFSASAVSPVPFPPISPVGSDPFVFGSLFSDLMGVHYSYNGVSPYGLQDFFTPNAREMNGLIWVGSIANGLVHLFGDNNLLQYFGGCAADKIDELAISSDSSGNAYSYSGSSFHGVPFSDAGSTVIFTPIISSHFVDKTSVGSSYYFSYDEFSIVLTVLSSQKKLEYYIGSELVYSHTLAFPRSTTFNFRFGYLSSDSSHRVFMGLTENSSLSWVNSVFTGEYVSVSDQSIDYVSDTVDTSILDDLPSGAGFEAVFPYNDEPDITSLIKSLADLILSDKRSDVEFQIVDDPPPVEPYDQTISDTSYTVLNETFQEFKEFFGDIYDSITDFKEVFGDFVDSIASSWTEVFGDIYDTLVSWQESFGDAVGDILDSLTDIKEAFADIVEDIKNGDFQFIDGFWKNFQTPFLPFFNTIKQHLGIWHYVVSWLSSIRSVFSFFFGVLSGLGSPFTLPIYAAFAGTVVIAVYRRFGK